MLPRAQEELAAERKRIVQLEVRGALCSGLGEGLALEPCGHSLAARLLMWRAGLGGRLHSQDSLQVHFF